MKLRDIFAFRDPPESETSKPFLEHLEDLRWTIVKMAIVLIVAMFLCFAFRQRLVGILQRPLERSRRPGRHLARARYHRLDHDFVSPRVLRRDRGLVSVPPLFPRAICPAGADRGREAVSFPRDRRQLRAFPDRRGLLLLLASPENDSLFLSRHPIVRLDADVDGAGILFVCDPLRSRLRAGLRIAGGGSRAGQVWPCHLRVHGPHPSLRHRPHFHPCHHHYAYA